MFRKTPRPEIILCAPQNPPHKSHRRIHRQHVLLQAALQDVEKEQERQQRERRHGRRVAFDALVRSRLLRERVHVSRLHCHRRLICLMDDMLMWLLLLRRIGLIAAAAAAGWSAIV